MRATLRSLATFARVLSSEGLLATRDRVLDRFAERRREHSMTAVSPSRIEFRPELDRAPVLNLSPLPPFPRRGGSQIQMLDRLHVESELRTVALMYPIETGWRLERSYLSLGEKSDLAQPADPEQVAATAEIIASAARLAGTGTVHIESLFGLPMDLGPALRDRGLNLVISVHDFSCFCRRPHLIELPDGAFCDFSTDPQRCRACLALEQEASDDDQERYRRRAHATLRSADTIIFPSEYLRDCYAQLFPEALAATARKVIEPATRSAPSPPPSADGPAHIALVGGMKHHKGGAVAVQMVERMSAANPNLRWTAYGDGEPGLLMRLRRTPGVTVRGYYRAGELPSLLRAAGATVAVLPSIWPEAYGLVVDECLLAGLPVVAFDRGAVGERIRRLESGRLADPQTGAEGLAEALRSLLAAGMRLPPEVHMKLPRPSQAALQHMDLYASMKNSS